MNINFVQKQVNSFVPGSFPTSAGTSAESTTSCIFLRFSGVGFHV